MQDDCPGERRSRELWRFNGVLPRRLGVPEDREHGRVRVAVGAIDRVTEPSRKSYLFFSHRALERLEGQTHPRKSEALRPKVVEGLKVVRMRKRMTTNDKE